MTARRRWTEETIENELASTVAELGRMPTRRELGERGLGGAWSAMQRHGGLALWRERLTARLEAPAPATVPDAPAPAPAPALETVAAPVVASAPALSAVAQLAPASHVAPAAVVPSRREIEERAYFIFEQRGGDPVSNWLTAERQLLAA